MADISLVSRVTELGEIIAKKMARTNGLETKISTTFLDFLHLGHEFFVISGHGALK